MWTTLPSNVLPTGRSHGRIGGVEVRAGRQLSALVEAGMVLASELDLDALLQRIADLSREVVGASYGAVGVVGTDGQLARFVYSGIDQETADQIGELPSGRGVLGALLEQNRPLRLREISDHPRTYGFPKHHPPMHTFLGVPIIVRGTVFGRLYLTEKHGSDEFTKDDERIAMTLAAQAGVAIENARLYDEIQNRGDQLARRMKQLSSVERVGNLLIQGGAIDEVLRSAVVEALILTGASRGTLLLLDGSSQELIVNQMVGAGSPEDVLGARLPMGSSKAHAVLSRRKGEAVDDLSADPEVHAETIHRLGDPRSGAFVPLLIGSREIGALAVYDKGDDDSFSADDLAILQILANQAAIALENARLTEALRDLAVLEERERIAKELHDGVIQSIYSVGLSLQGSTSMMTRDPALAAERIEQAISELDNVVRDVRSYIFELRPHVVEEKGLDEAILELLRDLEVNTLAGTSVDIAPGILEDLNEEQQRHLIQIVREALSNIARHGQASEVGLAASREDGELTIAITDNGIGFDPEEVKRGNGLTNIEQRARRLGGVIEMKPRDPKGMAFVIRIPMGTDVS